MARVLNLELASPGHPWRPAPMPGANLPIEVVRLSSPTAHFVILGRFPAGFERLVPGGYEAAEEFVVLKGAIELDGHQLRPGALTHVGAGRVRQSLVSPIGCVVLAWFDGPPDFAPEERLTTSPGVLELLALDDLREPRTTAVARWSRGAVEEWPAGADGFDELAWAASRADWTGRSDATVAWRTPLEQRREPHV